MRWFKHLMGKLQGDEPVPWEEAECLETFADSFLESRDGQPLLNMAILDPFVARKDRVEAYYWFTEAAKFWLLHMARVHPELRVYESPAFLLLTHYSEATVREVFRKIEGMRNELLDLFDGVARDFSPGKNVIAILPNEEIYYDYISAFYPEGEFAMSGGIQIREGYPHIASYHAENVGAGFGMMAHEMTHLYLSHLDLPRWLDEALAQTYENSVSPIYKDRPELDAKHQAYWTTEDVQWFWSGESFLVADTQDISYDLAHTLMIKLERVLKPEKSALLGFIQNASAQDHGEAAAQQHLGISLGDLAASFLGPGDWAPRPF